MHFAEWSAHATGEAELSADVRSAAALDSKRADSSREAGMGSQPPPVIMVTFPPWLDTWRDCWGWLKPGPQPESGCGEGQPSVALVTGLLDACHADKERVLWEAFKERLGHSERTNMAFNLNYFLSPVNGLESLEEPFSMQEIN